MENSSRIKRIILRDEVHAECQRRLRGQELNVYSEVMSAVRMSGGIDDTKRQFIKTVKNWFRIPDWRHQAEIRRVANDEQMELVADTISGRFTSQGWIEEGYNNVEADTTFTIRPIVTQEELVAQIVQRRLADIGVDNKTETEETLKSFPEDEPLVKSARLLLPDEPFCTETEVKPDIDANSIPLPYAAFVSNLETFSEINGDSRTRIVNRNVSPDITSLSNSAHRNKFYLHELKARLSSTSRADMDRCRRKAERAKALLAKAVKSRGVGRGRGHVSLASESLRNLRESTSSSTSSCFGAQDFIEQFGAAVSIQPTPRPARGRGSRGRSVTSSRGRGRGRGRPPGSGVAAVPSEIPRPIPLEEHQHLSFTPENTSVISNMKPISRRAPKSSSNGEDVKRRTTSKRRKSNIESLSDGSNLPLALQDGNVSPVPPSQLNPLESSYQRNSQFYSPDQPQVPGQIPNHLNCFSKHPIQLPRFQLPESPSKIRQKTKHTVIIQDVHESIPATSKASLPDYNEANTRNTLGLTSTPKSVVVRTPLFTNPPTTSSKIITAGGIPRTLITMPLHPRPGIYTSPSKGVEIQQRLPTSPQSTATSSIYNNSLYKKRTQNLAASWTYAMQTDNSPHVPDIQNPEVGLKPSSSSTPLITNVSGPLSLVGAVSAGTTASALARTRPLLEHKALIPSNVVSSATTATTSPASSFVKTSSNQSSSTPVIQRKAQPHILAGSKLHRSSVIANSTPVSLGTNLCPTSSASNNLPSSPLIPNVQNLPCTSSPTLGPVQPPTSMVSSVITMAPSVPQMSKPVVSPLATTLAITRAQNVILFQKNSSTNIPGQVISTSPVQSGGMLKGPGKAVILRRANNSNLMILEVPKNQIPTNTVSVLQGPHTATLGTTGNTGLRNAAPVSTIRTLIPSSFPLAASHLSVIPKPTRNMPPAMANAAPTKGPMTSQIPSVLSRPIIRAVATHAPPVMSFPKKVLLNLGNANFVNSRMSTIQSPGTTAAFTTTGSTSSTDTASEGEGDLATSLFANEILENSPAPPDTIDEEERKTPDSSYQPCSKTKISVVSSFSDDSSRTPDLSPIKPLTKEVYVSKSSRATNVTSDVREDEEETSSNSYCSNMYGENDDYVEDDEEEFDNNNYEEDESIELIDLEDEDHETASASRSTSNSTTMVNAADSSDTVICKPQTNFSTTSPTESSIVPSNVDN